MTLKQIPPKLKQEVKEEIVEQVAFRIEEALEAIRQDQSAGFMQLCQLLMNMNTTLNKQTEILQQNTEILQQHTKILQKIANK